MKLSIITVNLNNREGLQRTIDSVVSQTFHDFEWIVIDGGSTDGSKNLIERYADHFTYWVSEPDNGIYNAMNKGIKVAHGEYLQFLNSGDCFCDDTSLEHCFSHDFYGDLVYADLLLSKEGEKEVCIYPDTLTLNFFLNTTLCHNATFIKRTLFNSHYYNEDLMLVSDWEFFLTQLLNNKIFQHINEFVISYDLQGISSENDDAVVREREKVIEKLVPNAILEDYQHLKNIEGMLNQCYIKDMITYRTKSKLYRKIITSCFCLIKIIDKCCCKKI